jgi:hypothetical protein
VTVLAVVAGSAAAEDGWIAGKVSEGLTGVPGATVAVMGGTQTATTDASGNYNITVTNGTYSLKVTKSGYVDKTVDGVVVTVNNTTTQNVAIVKVTGYLTGIVKGDDGAPIQYASVNGALTDAQGKYNLTALPLGLLNVTVTTLDYPLYNFSVTIVAGQNTKDITLVMITYVQVYVTGPTLFGVPLPLQGATVTCGNATGTTDALGMVKLIVPPGSYKISLKAKDYKNLAKDITVTRGDNTFNAQMAKTSGSNDESGLFAGILAAGIAICILIILIPIILIVLIIVWLVRRKKSNQPAPPMQAPPMAPPPQTPPPGAPPAPPQS